MTNSDPTHAELLACAAAQLPAGEYDEFDVEEAIYWFASDWHGGQWSNLYGVLSTSQFRPSLAARGIDKETLAGYLYDQFVLEFTKPT